MLDLPVRVTGGIREAQYLWGKRACFPYFKSHLWNPIIRAAHLTHNSLHLWFMILQYWGPATNQSFFQKSKMVHVTHFIYTGHCHLNPKMFIWQSYCLTSKHIFPPQAKLPPHVQSSIQISYIFHWLNPKASQYLSAFRVTLEFIL